MVRTAEKRSVDRLLEHAKVDKSDKTKYAKCVEACINVTFHNQKGLCLAKLSGMKKALSPGMRLWPALAFSPERRRVFIQLCRCV
jgi:hypothetical protein